MVLVVSLTLVDDPPDELELLEEFDDKSAELDESILDDPALLADDWPESESVVEDEVAAYDGDLTVEEESKAVLLCS